jgi:hypothetical protein
VVTSIFALPVEPFPYVKLPQRRVSLEKNLYPGPVLRNSIGYDGLCCTDGAFARREARQTFLKKFDTGALSRNEGWTRTNRIPD